MPLASFLIVGGGLAGARAAAVLRERGFDGRVTLVGAERERPYERPPLSKDYLRGEAERERAYAHSAGFYADHEIELRTGTTVGAIVPRERVAVLSDGEALRFDRLLLCTGAVPRPLRVEGAELDGVRYLRTLEDCDALRARLAPGVRVAVVGAGWIGSECAASARQLGAEVTLIDPLALPNERRFGREIGEFYRDVHAGHGVRLALGTGVARFLGSGGALSGVELADGRRVECDLAIVGVGVAPCVSLAQRSGLELEDGVVVDERLQTSAPQIFAAGDVANARHPFYGRRIRVEHWANARDQGAAAARSMLGDRLPDDRIPYFFSDQYDVGMEYSGNAPEWDEIVFRGSRDDGEFIAFWLRDGRVLAGMNVNVRDVNEQVQALIRSRRPVDAAALRDADTPLDSLAPIAA